MSVSPSSDEGIRHLTVEVRPDEVGERLDVVLAGRLELSRTRIQKLMAAGEVRVAPGAGCARRPARKSEVAEPGWVVEVDVPPPVETELVAEDLPLTICYEDEHLAVVDKPAGMVVHPAPGHRSGTMVNALMHHLDGLSGVGGRLRPGIVHRLDKDTSGLLVVAKNDATHQHLSDALRRRHVKRLYAALVWGHLDLGSETLTIDAPLARDPRNRKRMAVVEGGKRAVTRARIRERFMAAELLDVALQTGRTHQIRVHLAHRGHPVVGDVLYGAGWERGMSGDSRPWARELARRVSRQFLHAAELAFDHPASGERIRVRSPLPEDLASAARWARGEGT